MGQSLEIDLNGKTTVPEAVDKSKKAIKSFGEQVGDVKKKFGESFKDIFLSFLGPMALLGAAIGFIGKLIADNQKKREDANQAAIEGTNKLMSAEDKYYANKRNNEKKAKETVKDASIQRETTTEEFLKNDPRGQEIYANIKKTHFQKTFMGLLDLEHWARDPKVQDQVQAIIAEDMKKNPLAPELKTTSYSGPQGFSNVVGMGPNAVLQAQIDQLEELKRHTVFLERIAASGGYTPPDFTKGSKNATAAPSRSYLLTK